MTMQELQNDIVADLTTELSEDDDFSEAILTIKVKNAIREIKSARNYPTSYTDEMVVKDLETNYYSTIVNLARYDYNQIGAEGEDSHSEGDVSRSWVDRKEFFNGVTPFVRIL